MAHALTQAQIDGHSPVKVFSGRHDGERKFEGLAVILKVLQGDAAGVHAEVRMRGDGAHSVTERWIFAGEQD